MLFSHIVVASLPLLSLVSAAPVCGLVPPKPVAPTAVTVAANLSDDFVAEGWYPGWRSDVIPPANLSWSKYNVMSFAFAVTTPDVSSLPIASNDSFSEFVTLAKNNGVKALLTVGGWTGSQYFSRHVGDAQNRTAFVNTCYNLLMNNNLDGLDFDWEFPNQLGIGCNDMSANDTPNFISFLQELRAKLGPDYMITLAVGAKPYLDVNGVPMTNVSAIADVVDHISIMAYDFNGPFSTSGGIVGPNAPVDDSCSTILTGSLTSAVEAWTAANFPANKVCMRNFKYPVIKGTYSYD
ncbi:hypothetical protein C0991_005770 [Blastosporella zonata]|nr:hypothetical protein C0991_005770 [Blastosporella zonata]